MCYIAEGRTGACDRYGNAGGRIVRLDPLTILEQPAETGGAVVPFDAARTGTANWSTPASRFVTAIGAGTTYPDYKPAPFIVTQEVEGVDLVTVVTEGIFSYCGVKVKIDTDRHLGPETATVRGAGRGGRPCHDRRIRLADAVARRRASSDRRLEVGRPRHLRDAARPLQPEAGRACHRRRRRRSSSRPASRRSSTARPSIACASAAARPPSACSPRNGAGWSTRWWWSTTTSPASSPSTRPARCWAGRTPASRSSAGARRPGRYFKVSEPGLGWGGTTISDPLSILGDWNAKKGARPGLSLLMVSTTGEQFAYYELDETLKPVEKPFPERLQKVGRADRGQLRAGAVHGAVRRRRRRLAAGRRGREPGQSDALGAGPEDLCDGRRRAGLCLAGRRHHADGRRDAGAGKRLRLCADAGAGRADRVHAAPRRLSGARRPRRGDPQPSTTSSRKGGEYLNPRREQLAPAGNPWPPLAQLRRAPRTAVHERPAGRTGCRRAAAASQPRADRPDRRGVRRARRDRAPPMGRRSRGSRRF